MDPITTSVNDAAKALGLGRTTIYALIRDGRLETAKVGRRTLIKVASIRRLVGEEGGASGLADVHVAPGACAYPTQRRNRGSFRTSGIQS